MAGGGGLCHSFAVALCPYEVTKGVTSVLVFTWLVLGLVSMETPAVVADKSDCFFEGIYLPSLPALELTCQCPKDTAGFGSLNLYETIKIKFREVSGEGSGERLLYDPRRKKILVPDLEVVTDEKPVKHGKRAKLTLRRMNYTALTDNATYTCFVEGEKSDGSPGRKVLPLLKVEGLPTTATTPTLAPTTAPIRKSTTLVWLPPITPAREDITRIAATAGKAEDGFSSVGLYIVVALSCVLLIVIVFSIICFVRVRARRRREKLARMEDLELEDLQPHGANSNLIHKPAEPSKGGRQPCNSTDKLLCKSNGDCSVSHSPACKMIGHSSACAVHTPCQPQTCAIEVHGQGKRERGTLQADAVPLLEAHRKGYGQRQRQRGSATSEDEEELTGRRERLLMNTPRRPRPRDCVVPGRPHPGHSRSFDDDLDREESQYPYGRSHTLHRYSFPRNVFDETSDDEDLPDPGRRHQRRHPAYGYPHRSWSQHSLHRHHGRQRGSSTEEAYPEDYTPVWLSTGPRPYRGVAVPRGDREAGQFQATPVRLPSGHRYVYVDSQAQHPPRGVLRQAVQGAEAAPPLIVRVQEDHPMRYQDPHPTRQDGNWPPTSTGGLDGATSGTEATEQDYPPEQVGRDLQAEREVAVVHAGEAPGVSRLVQQQPRLPLDGRYPSGTMPSTSRSRYASSPSRSRQYSTTSMPRRTSNERGWSRSARPPRHNLSQPHLIYRSDIEADTEPCLYPGSESEDFLQPSAAQPYSIRRSHSRPHHGGNKRRRSRSVGNITAGAASADPRHLHSRGGEGGRRRGISPERPAPHVAFLEVSPLSSPGGRGELQRPMNLLSRDDLSPSRGRTPPPLLNVPVTHEQAALGASTAARQQEHDSTHRKTPRAYVPGHAPRVDSQWEGRPRPSESSNIGVARATDSSPNTTPPQDRRSSVSTSDNDSLNPSSSRGRRRRRERAPPAAEIEVSDIKTEYETRRKRPVSFKVGNRHNARPPVVCAADAVESHRGAVPTPAHSLRSAGGAPPHCASRGRGDRRQDEREGSEQLREQFGVQVSPSLDNSANGQFSHFTENNHSTSAKTPHPRPE